MEAAAHEVLRSIENVQLKNELLTRINKKQQKFF